MDTPDEETCSVVALPLARVRPLGSLDPDDAHEAGVLAMCDAAERFLADTPFCEGVGELHLGYCVPDVIVVVLAHIARTVPGPSWLWVVVGDLPPAILWSDWMTTPDRALEGDVRSMGAWIEAARTGGSVEGLIRVDVPATPGWAEALAGRVSFVEKRPLPEARAGVHVSG